MKKVIWLVVSILMALSLVVASCGTTTVEEEEEEEVVTEEEEEEEEQEDVVDEKEMVRDSLGRMVEKPKYGGTVTRYAGSSPTGFEEAFSSMGAAWNCVYTNEGLLTGNWAKGPTGSGEVAWRYATFPPPDILTGLLAESFEIVDDTTIKYTIRQGIYFHNKPPVNGRELDANDVVESFMRAVQSPQSYLYRAHGIGRTLESVTAPDKWTVILKSVPGRLYDLYWGYNCNAGAVWPHEVWEEYGDANEWQNSCGTGPFMLTDYVPDSVIKYEKNPNYWRKHPLFPEDKMPYIDNLRILIIPDLSTRYAAFRTGKIDQIDNIALEDKVMLERSNPEVIWDKYLSTSFYSLSFRPDLPDVPWYDVNVRKALSMAVDREEIAEGLYGGDVEMFTVPVSPIPELSDYYTPFDELPESLREIYAYNPEKAKELLVEAGYPDGFRAEILCSTPYVDTVSIIKDYWEKLNVTLDLRVVETGAFRGILNAREYEMVWTMKNAQRPEAMAMYTVGQSANHFRIDDPKINEWNQASLNTFFTDRAANIDIVKEAYLYIIDLALSVDPPQPYIYIGWHPWLQSYNGEISCGARNSPADWPKYLWIDQELKKSLGY
ncbi:ABC transporter substrate-binding protein [Chloroflexota bacterium]